MKWRTFRISLTATGSVEVITSLFYLIEILANLENVTYSVSILKCILVSKRLFLSDGANSSNKVCYQQTMCIVGSCIRSLFL